MFKNIIFDWSGVIKDCVNGQLLVVNEMFSEFDVPPISLKEFKENWEQPYMKFYNKYIPNLTLEEEQKAYKKALLRCPKAKYYKGMTTLVKDLHKKSVKMVVISSDFLENLNQEIIDFNLNNIFIDIISNSHDKTDATVNVINKYSFNKLETVIIGDSNHEIEVGKKVGIKTIGVTWGFTDKNKLSISNPDFIATNINELKKLLL